MSKTNAGETLLAQQAELRDNGLLASPDATWRSPDGSLVLEPLLSFESRRERIDLDPR